MQQALERVRAVLEAERAPRLAHDVHHQYSDKYILAECITNTAAASQANCLSTFGASADQLRQLAVWAEKSVVVLRFDMKETCTYLRKETREQEDPTKHVVEASVGGVIRGALTSKVVTKIEEHFWKFEAVYELVALRGVGAKEEDQIRFMSHTAHAQVKTSTDATPYPAFASTSFEVNISWLAKHLGRDNLSPGFRIDRADASCHTPRRNKEIDQATAHFGDFQRWCSQVQQALSRVARVQPESSIRSSFEAAGLNDFSILTPVLPLLEEGRSHCPTAESIAATSGSESVSQISPPEKCGDSIVFAVPDFNRLLDEESRLLRAKHTQLAEALPGGDSLGAAFEAKFIVTMAHCHAVCQQWMEACDYVEQMLRQQLVAAIGKEVSPADFAQYMQFHNRKVFNDAYAPTPFCFAVRRSDCHSPEGTVSIEEEVVGPGGDSNIAAPIWTLAARSTHAPAMCFPISSSTNISFGGDRYLHAWLSHNFSGHSGAKLALSAKARQFSSMLVLIGRIASATTFDPKYAAIVQNKDELTIPLDLSTIPAPKEFKDAIESLSPEQQEFAKAFRAMQLESTLFGVLIIPIKPQLEKVLNLADDSLTKEIKLTQDLMQLFITYQIPSDLLSYDAASASTAASGDVEVVGGATPQERLQEVRRHVKAMQDMIEQSKQEEIHDRVQQASFAAPQLLLRATEESEHMDFMCAAAAPREELRCADMPLAGAPGMLRKKASNRAAPAPPRAPGCPPPPPPCMQQQQQQQPPQPSATASQPPPRPQETHQQQSPLEQPQQQVGASDDVGEPSTGRDYTQVPVEMDARFEKFDPDARLRPTIITPGSLWKKRAQKALLAQPIETSLVSDEQKHLKDAAFDLLDALTKSGALPIEHASLHVVVAATHCFDLTVMETVIQQNTNPIEKVERSTLIMASTVHQRPPAALVRDVQLHRINAASPGLFLEDGDAA